MDLLFTYEEEGDHSKNPNVDGGCGNE